MAIINHHLFLEFQKFSDWKNLTNLQQEFCRLFFTKKNLFLSGSAGTGKSYVIEKLCDFLENIKHPVGKTALTGVAALNVGGSTVHSWCGIGLADDDGMALLDKVSNNKKATNRIKNSKLLIIDEISMASASLLDKIDIVCQFIRNCEAPFGGLQVIFVGDFCQLPPVFNKFEEAKFAFESEAWNHAKITTINLTEIIRQHDDVNFAKFLNEVRFGTTTGIDILTPCYNRQFPDDGIAPVRLFCKNYNVDQYNNDRLDKLNSKEKVYYPIDDAAEQWVKFLDKNCRAPSPLTLKVGAQVMLLVNLDVIGGLVNGSVGIVEKLHESSVDVRFITGTFSIEPFEWEIKQNEVNVLGETKKVKVASRKQIPLRLSWANTIHKVQGATLDRAEVDASEAFSDGQVYVALSRIRDLESLRMKKFDVKKITANKKCIDFYRKSEQDRKQLEQFFEH